VIILIIDVSEILNEVGSTKVFSGSFLPDDIIFQGEEIKFLEPFSINGTVMNSKGGILLVQATVKGHCILQCGACMEPYSQSIGFSFTVEFRTSGSDPDIYIYTGNSIDLRDAIMDYFLLELPTRRRCREDCKGLCPKCGVNLNYNQCTCKEEEKEQEEYIDSRLAVLKDFFSSSDKEV